MPLPRRLRKYLYRRGISIPEIKERARSNKEAAKPSRPRPLDRTCHLLALPAELRNTIYLFALQEDSPIQLEPELRQPSLLLVNHQVRNETLELWYSINAFVVTVRDCDARLALKWHRYCETILSSDIYVPVHYDITGDAHWRNLLEWLYGRWEVGLKFNMAKSDFKLRGAAVGFARRVVGRREFLRAAHDLLDEFLERPWTEFLKAVDCLRIAVWAHDDVWDG